MFLIIGLGNPGRKYEKTRHNAGFISMARLRRYNPNDPTTLLDYGGQGFKFKKNTKLKSEIAEININNQKVILAKPLTYMNNSGQAVRVLADYYKIKPKNIIIIYDEIDLDFGKVRVRDTGSSAGHKGIKSIISHLGTQDFYRIRIGIANNKTDKMDASKFVLKKFSRAEMGELKKKILPEVEEKLKKIIS